MKKSLFIITVMLIGFSLHIYNPSFLIGKELINKKPIEQKDKNDVLNSNKPIRIGYFHGGRIHLLYRAYINNYFDDEDIDVELYSEYLLKDGWNKIPKNHEEMEKNKRTFGRVTGIRIIEAMDKGILVGGTVGESSFVSMITNGSPIIAVAMLGHETIERPAKAIAIRKDIIINKPEDFKGKTLITRRAGPGDGIFLREFIENIGLDPDRDITIIDQVPDNREEEFLKEKKVDGGIFHLHKLRALVTSEIAYLYRKMDWLNPEISHALLVFRKDFVEAHPERVKKIIRAYMRRIKYEHSMPEEEKIKEKRFGLQMILYFQGLNLPQYNYPPLVRQDLLKEVQRLLLKYKFIDREIDLEKFINNSFVEEIYKELK